ncbi:Mediator of RNA polymerase II transcription subunit 14 [Rhynchospora pubera]|uniref:Mediator of RNA polymerase II transcription subunit 14 n=1 Tax=Rhynchospora pubera TaxID=906938 RepID=A0AAV8EW92_9POAL|nr:Mediator of RNA polymerase II transcription subunit 14 [Rhynchospora pubera]
MEVAELGRETVEFSALVRRAAEDSYLALKELVEKSQKGDELGQHRSDSEKKIDLLKFIARTRQRMLRLHVLAKWCQQVPLVDYCRQLASTLSIHETCFTQTADSLFFVHDGLQQARAPIFDVPSAIEVFLTGGYSRLPKCIEDLGLQSTLPEAEQKPALKKLNTLVRSKLLETVVPKEVSHISVSDGVATFRVDGEFKILLTLGYRGHLHLWRILHLELLIGEKTGPIKLEASRRYALGDDLERRMAVSENPFSILYTILHELCVALLMDTVIRQAQILRQGRWRDAIRFDLISDNSQTGQTGGTAMMQLGQEGELDSTGLRIPGLKITYWLDTEKSSTPSTEQGSSAPFVRIEPGPDLHIRCVHGAFILDPLTDKEATLTIDQSCIDVEKLLLRAIACNRHTRLLEIQRELIRNVQISRAYGDVVLKHEGLRVDEDRRKKEDKLSTEDYYTDEVLQVRAYGNSYITLGVNIRSGHFFLQSSKNVVVPSVISRAEDSLNKGLISPVDAFVSLRSKSILHLFANTGKFLGLKVYDQILNSLKIPKQILLGSDMSIMGFPQCGNSYYLLMQLDKEFKPVFHLLETQSAPPAERRNSITDVKNIIRVSEIDISQMPVTQDDLNTTSLLKWEKIQMMLQSNPSTSNQIIDNGLEPVLQLPGGFGGSRSTFSSIVDEVFESEKSNANMLSSFSSQSHLSTSYGYSAGLIGSGTGNYLQSHNSFAASSPSRSLSVRKVGPSKSDQDLRSLHSPDIRQSSVIGGSSTSARLTMPSTLQQPWPISDSASSPATTATECPMYEKATKKRSISEILCHIPSLQGLKTTDRAKRRKVSETTSVHHTTPQSYPPVLVNRLPSNLTYGNLLSERNHGIPASTYSLILIQVVRQCLICIKHAQLTSQMDVLDISYVEDSGLRSLSSSLWLRLPFARDDAWRRICLRLGKPGSLSWDVKINDTHFRELWELNAGSTGTPWGPGVRIANTSDTDSHISFDLDGVTLAYKTVEADSIKRLVSDLRRLLNARSFACGMRRLVGLRLDEKMDEEGKGPSGKGGDSAERLSEVRKAFKIEAVGLMSLWFCYGSMPSVHFVVEWEAEKEGCTMHVSPDQLWPHTKFLEDFVNGGEVASFLDCIRLTAGPLLALGAAIRPARMPVTVSAVYNPMQKQAGSVLSQGILPNGSSANHTQPLSSPAAVPPPSTVMSHLTNQNLHAAMLSAAGRERPGIVPSSLLPFDVSVVLRGPYWIRIIYRKKFAVDMRCFAGDQVWLQPATPPKGGPSAGGSLPCPQFRPFIMEHVAQGLSALEPNFPPNSVNPNATQPLVMPAPGRANMPASGGMTRPGSGPTVQGQVPVQGGLTRPTSAILAASSGLAGSISGIPGRLSQGGLPVHMKGELNTAFIGLGDDGGYGGGWVPLAALKKVLRGILKYLGVLWLFAQLPELLKEILGSILKENEGALLNLDQEQPALRFFVGGYVFAVSVHRVQLLLQVLSVKRFHHQQQQQQQQQPHQNNAQEELSPTEINEICEYFTRRVASEPYDASRVASFITLLTLPISALREFLKLIAWKKGLSQAHGGDIGTAQRPRIELCLENHSGYTTDDGAVSKSNIHHDRARNLVDFGLTFVLDSTQIPHMNVAGGAAWLPYCVSVRLRYSFGDAAHNHNLGNNNHVSFVGMEGSHGGRACWLQYEDWERCKQRVARTVEVANNGAMMGDASQQGRLKLVAETVQKTLQTSLQQMRDGPISAGSVAN